jgi:hypothetical protein
MLKYLTLPALAILAACATPQEQCINTASNQVRTMQTLINTTEGNIARGYAIHRSQEPYEVIDVCYDTDGKSYNCFHTEYRTKETPVTIDVAEERRKLAQLKRRLPAEKRKMDAAISNCRIQFPE